MKGNLKSAILLIMCIFMIYPLSIAITSIAHASNRSCQIVSTLVKKSAKKSAKKALKKTAKANFAKSIGKSTSASIGKKSSKRLALKSISKSVLANMTEEQQQLFQKKGYKQIAVTVNGKNKPLLVSKEFDPNLKISREYTGDWDPVKFHKNDPRYVVDGCETNLGRMRRGLAPLFKDPTNKNPKWHGYSEFDLHHGGQKADPNYFALMGKEHETESKILHTVAKGVKSEINRGDFAKKERSPLYKQLAEQLIQQMDKPKAILE